MFGAVLKLLAFSNRPTGRTLRLLSCPPRLPNPRKISRILKPASTSGSSRRIAIVVIEIEHHCGVARTDRSNAVPVHVNFLM